MVVVICKLRTRSKKKILADNPETTILQVDIFNDWMGKFFGSFFTQCWNTPLRKGHHFISLFTSYFGIPIADPIFFIPIFIQAFLAFQRYPITEVIDTQPMGTSAICLAMKLSNRLKKQKLVLNKILTEIPTRRAIHFFHPLKLMPKLLRKLIQLHIVEPFPQEQNFFKRQTGLEKDQIQLIDPPLREAFFDQMLLDSPKRKIAISFQSDVEKLSVVKIGKLENYIEEQNEKSLTLNCQNKSKIITIMLGSQPHTKVFEKYLDGFINSCKKKPHISYFIFILGNPSSPGFEDFRISLLYLDSRPKNFHPIILSIQEQKTVAHLLKYSDLTITRSGGLTSMELLKVEQKNARIHTNFLKEGKPSLKRMPPWEIGNAEVLIEKIGAKMIHPDLIEFLE